MFFACLKNVIIFVSSIPILLSSDIGLSRTLEGGADEQQPQHAAAPCVEYFVRETLFDRLVALGLADRPPGMRRLIAKSLDALFTHLRRGQLLPHVSIRASLLQVG
jgi:hypothetical protein